MNVDQKMILHSRTYLFIYSTIFTFPRYYDGCKYMKDPPPYFSNRLANHTFFLRGGAHKGEGGKIHMPPFHVCCWNVGSINHFTVAGSDM